VADRATTIRRPLVGRAGDIDVVVELIEAAARGEAGALLIAGEAGVGKTALVREAAARVSADTDVLWAPCLPLTSLATPFLPLTTAVREWAAGRDVPVPMFGESGEEGPAGFDTWLEDLCRRRHAILVVDDLQWADQSSLDVLMYVLAGLASRRLAVVTTVRAGEEGEPLRRWLADVRRFPGVAELTLGRLDRVATGEQLAGLLGLPPHQSLIDDVYTRTQGNAYLTTLIVRDVSPDARSLPAGLPVGLRDAATRAWRGLSAPAQRLTQLIAIAGRPQRADQLGEVAAAAGASGSVVPLLREAVDGAVLGVGADAAYWFVHPLLAEVLEDELLPDERGTLHAAFAAVLEPDGNAYEMSVDAIVDLADHHYQAGHKQDAYRWALVAAEAAGQVGGAAEMLRLLRRALDLLSLVPDPGVYDIDLLQRIRAAAEQAGEMEAELAAIDDLLSILNRETQPLLAAELLVRRTQLSYQTNSELGSVGDAQEAVRISAQYPNSVEYVLAMAERAGEEIWDGLPAGAERADEAVRLARKCGSARALAYALISKAMARVFAGDSGGLIEATEAQEAAATARDFLALMGAATWAANSLDFGLASREVIEHTHRSREQLISLGAPHSYVAKFSAEEALGLLFLGEWRACVDRLREVLGSAPGPKADVIARVTAALLAVWQGRLPEAEAHLARAEEISATRGTLLFYGFDAVRTELALAKRDTEGAFASAMAKVERGGHANLVERLVPLAARAMADEAQALRDRGEDAASAVTRLEEFRRRYPAVVTEVGPGPAHRAEVAAMQSWYDAEVRRGRDDIAAAATWQHTAQACLDAGLAWDEAYAWWRAAEALAEDRTRRDEAAAALRRAHELAVDLQAVPLLAEIEALARSTRISVTAVDDSPPAGTAALPSLTPREREVLAHIVAGRTYGEIARELVLSEKTVSVHVSNMLHKTGAANRVELAQLARRLAAEAN
jgi:DNA-binding CsgD family transcriptional regulator